MNVLQDHLRDFQTRIRTFFGCVPAREKRFRQRMEWLKDSTFQKLHDAVERIEAEIVPALLTLLARNECALRSYATTLMPIPQVQSLGNSHRFI